MERTDRPKPWQVDKEDARVQATQAQRHASAVAHKAGDRVTVKSPNPEIGPVPGLVESCWHNSAAGCYVVRVRLESGEVLKVEAGRVRKIGSKR